MLGTAEHPLGSREIPVGELAGAPEKLIYMSRNQAFAIPREEMLAIQRDALRTRFHQMVDKIPVLQSLAREQGIAEIETLEDGAPLLFRHTVYKSYPISLLEKNRFNALTEWLDALTANDLSAIDASGIDSIDDWLDLLRRGADLRVTHTAGTSGKLSFLPRAEAETPHFVQGLLQNCEGFGQERNATPATEAMPLVFMGYRHGAHGFVRAMDGAVRYLYGGDESQVLTLYPGRMSADVLSLAGRLKALDSRGEQARLKLSEKLRARREQYAEEQAEIPERMRAFLDACIQRFAGKPIMSVGVWGQFYDVASAAKDKGVAQLFAGDSRIVVAGGMKGRVLPDGFGDLVTNFLGVPSMAECYGMTEISGLLPKCPEGHYHMPPWVIPYALHPESGVPFPRTGTVTGRLGLIDLVPSTLWGGFLSGDEVTLSFGDDAPCSCGRIGSYLHSTIRRYSELQGGDDKVSCAGVPEAFDKALAFIADYEKL